MSNYPDDYDYYEREPSEFDQAVNEFKDLLRDEVKGEVKRDLENLRKENTELLSKMGNLTVLENEARQAKYKYEMGVERAKIDAKRSVQQESAAELLKVIGVTKFAVKSDYVMGQKCDQCDGARRRHFTTPLGKETYEACDCHTGKTLYEVTELDVLEIGKRRGQYTVWYTPSTKQDRERHFEDSAYGRVYKKPEPLEKMVESSYSDYGFDTREEAQVLADALNGEVAKKGSPQW